MPDSICYLNGHWGPLANAKVSVLDRGFIFGDGIYEVVPVFSGTAFRLTEHLQRLDQSLTSVGMKNPLSTLEWVARAERLIRANNAGDQNIYIQVTRGVAPRRHALTVEIEPTVFLMSSPVTSDLDAAPIAAITLDDFRWRRCDIKSTSLLANVMSRFEASLVGTEEAIFIRDGYVTEGAASNVFVVRGGQVRTPPLSADILSGVTRGLMVELLVRSEIDFIEGMISKQELHSADEVWVTSSGQELVAVIRIDDRPIGDGRIGTIFRNAQSIYQEFKQSFGTQELHE